jgi:hypothetical protein
VTVVFPRSLRLHAKIPRVDHTRMSYPMVVRDGIMNRLKAKPYFSTFKFSTSRAVQIQPQSLPFCGVYFLQETQTPDGDINAGEVRFRVSARYGFSVIVLNNNPEEAEYQIDRAMMQITSLFSDPTLYGGADAEIQGFAGGNRQHVFGNAGQDNVTPTVELRYELTCDLGTVTYEPVVPDILEVIRSDTSFPIGGTAQQHHDTQQVVSQYDMEQN